MNNNDRNINGRNDRSAFDMDDRTEGSLKQTGGSIKESAGKIVGDEKMKREGQADQGEGKLQNAWGSIKDKAREITGSDDKR
jgi:uncharacterized protein YjbJ (UPF0337 family)